MTARRAVKRRKRRPFVAYPGYLADAGERLFWTAASIGSGAFLAWSTSGDAWSWRTFGFALAVNVAKLVAARQVGGKTARALPGHHDTEIER